MALVVPDVGKKPLLGRLIGTITGQFNLHLYKNDLTPDNATVLADLTQADFDGYAPVVMDNPVVLAILDATRRSVARWDQITFSCPANNSKPQQIYGYYVTDTGNSRLEWAERFAAAPIPFFSPPDNLAVIPQLTLKSQFSN